jgi:hypothetical protein
LVKIQFIFVEIQEGELRGGEIAIVQAQILSSIYTKKYANYFNLNSTNFTNIMSYDSCRVKAKKLQ